MSEENTRTDAAASAPSRPMDKDSDPGERKFRGKRRRKVSYLTLNKIETVDYKEVNILRRFINDRGKILPSRQTGNTAKQQRMIARAIRRARELALLPFVVTEMTADRREPRRDRPPRDYRDREPREHREPREPRESAPEPKAEAPAPKAEAAAPEAKAVATE